MQLKWSKQCLWPCLWTFLFGILLTACKASDQPPLNKEAENAFIEHMVKTYHFDREELTQTLSQAKYDPATIDRIMHPDENKPWDFYRSYFITDKRIHNGVAYWKAHEKTLQYAQNHYGIPPAIIIAIIGMESNYGEKTGEHEALDALSTLAFNYTPRSKFFTHELGELFLLTKEQHLPLMSIKSSYAGALGIPQFMPSTYRHYAVDYPTTSKDSRIDLMNNQDQAIVSVANFFHKHGWTKNQPIACSFTSRVPFHVPPFSEITIAHKPVSEFIKKGVAPACSLPPNSMASVAMLTLENGDGEGWLILHNFRVIMDYNPRIVYAMAVYQLAQAIQQQYDSHSRPTPSQIVIINRRSH